MALPINADVVVVRGYWWDEVTQQGVTSGTVSFKPVPVGGTAGASKTPNLRDLGASGYVKTRARVAPVDSSTGYFATLLVASNDPDLDAYGGREVVFASGSASEPSFIVEVPYNAPTVTVDAAMAAATGLAQGGSVRAVWLADAALLTNPTPTPPINYLTSAQTLSAIASGVEAHDEDTAAHPDIRQAIVDSVPTTLPPSGAAGGVLSGTFPNPGFASDMATQAELDAVSASIPEAARDALGAALVAGSNVTITPDDAGDTITISVSVPPSYSDEQAQDAFAALIAAGTHSGISFAYNDAGNAISATVAAQSWSQITGKPTFATVATSGSYTDLSSKPTIPAAYSDLTGTVPQSALPSVALTDYLGAVASQAAMLALTGQRGDWCTRTDLGTDWQLITDDPTQLANWRQHVYPASPVSSVNGRTGAVTGLAEAAHAASHNIGGVADISATYVPWANVDAAGGVAAYNSTQSALAGKAPTFTQAATKTANYTAADYEIVPLDTTGATFTLTGPTSGKPFGFRWKAGTAAPTIAAPAGYTITGAASVTPALPPSTSSGEFIAYQAFGTDYQVVGAYKPQVALNAANDARYPRKRVVDVRDFGAVLDGTTDDSAALYNAIMSVSTGGTVQVPAKCTLRLTSALGGATNTSLGTPRSLLNLVGLTNVTIEGAGASSKITTSVQNTTLLELRGCTNTVVRGFTIVGTDTYTDTSSANVAGQLIRLTGCTRCTITGNWLTGAWGVYSTGGTQYSLVTHNQVYSTNGNGINEDNVPPEVGGANVTPYANIYSHNVLSGINASGAIVVDNGGVRSFTQVAHNTIKGTGGGQGIRVLNPNGVSVIGNLIDSTAREGIYLGMAEFGSSGNRGAVEVSSNTVVGCGNYAFASTVWPGIRVDSLTSSAIIVEDTVTISNNIVRNSYAHGIEVHGALANIKVSTNTLYQNAKRGIYVWSDVTANRSNLMVQGNDVDSNADDGIRIECLSSATLRRIKVDDNSIAYNGKYGLVLNQAATNAITDVTVNNNTFDNNGTTASTTYSQASLSGHRVVFSSNFVGYDTNAGVAGIVWATPGTPGTAGVVVDCHQVLNKFNGSGSATTGGGVDGSTGSGVLVMSMRGGDAGFIGFGIGNVNNPNFRLEVNGDIRIQGTRRLYLGGFGSSDQASSIYSGGTGIVATDNRLTAAQGLATIDLGDVTGKTSAQIDALFTVAPGNGTVATGLNSANPVSLLRRNGKWNVSSAYTVIA